MKLTEKQTLVLEVLVARHRLGENLWTFEERTEKVLSQLEAKGLVIVMHGVVEDSVRARLTDKAKKKFLYDGYTPPILKSKL